MCFCSFVRHLSAFSCSNPVTLDLVVDYDLNLSRYMLRHGFKWMKMESLQGKVSDW